jgi:YY1-associated factor 2
MDRPSDQPQTANANSPYSSSVVDCQDEPPELPPAPKLNWTRPGLSAIDQAPPPTFPASIVCPPTASNPHVFLSSAHFPDYHTSSDSLPQPLRRTMDWQSVNDNRLQLHPSNVTSCLDPHRTVANRLTNEPSNDSIDSVDSILSSASSSNVQNQNQNLDPNSVRTSAFTTRDRDEAPTRCSTMSDGKRQSSTELNIKTHQSLTCSEPLSDSAHLRPPSQATIDSVSADDQCSQDSNDSTITNRSRDSEQQFEKQLLGASNGATRRGRPSSKQSNLIGQHRHSSLSDHSTSGRTGRSREDSRSPVNDSIDQSEVGWGCSVCTYRNPPDAFKCLICDVRKGMSTRKPRVNPQLLAAQVARQQQQIQEQALKASAKQAEKSTKTPTITSEKRRTDSDGSSTKGKRRSDGTVRKVKHETEMSGLQEDGDSVILNAKPAEPGVSADAFDRNSSESRQITVNNVTVEIVEYQLKKCDADSPDKGGGPEHRSAGKKSQSAPKAKV